MVSGEIQLLIQQVLNIWHMEGIALDTETTIVNKADLVHIFKNHWRWGNSSKLALQGQCYSDTKPRQGYCNQGKLQANILNEQ